MRQHPTRGEKSRGAAEPPTEATSDNWVRRSVHFRGWAHWDCDPAQKLDRRKPSNLQQQLFQMLPNRILGCGGCSLH